jgi:hypothetical protein
MAAVARYDRVINQRLLAATCEAEQRHWWNHKVTTKQTLETLSLVEAVALAERLAQELEAEGR